jgi:hypothetical protein
VKMDHIEEDIVRFMSQYEPKISYFPLHSYTNWLDVHFRPKGNPSIVTLL